MHEYTYILSTHQKYYCEIVMIMSLLVYTSIAYV